MKPREKANSNRGKPGKHTRLHNFLVELMYLLLKIAALAIAVVLIFTFLFGAFRTNDVSMAPAIQEGDLILYYRLDKSYVASDTLVLKYKDQTQVRRVIAVAGDTVDITENGLSINGAVQDEPRIYEETYRYDTGVEFPLTVPEGEVFVLGDGRESSTDSRIYGTVRIKDTMGKVMAVIRRRGI
jgi:signal peptidase I